jgi:hypothetical protein
MSKALDLKNATITDQDKQIRSLKQLVRHLQPKKGAKAVPPSPNSRFVSLDQIKEVKDKIAKVIKKEGLQIEDIATFDKIMDYKSL